MAGIDLDRTGDGQSHPTIDRIGEKKNRVGIDVGHNQCAEIVAHRIGDTGILANGTIEYNPIGRPSATPPTQDVVGDEAALNESSSRPDRSAIGHPRSLPVAIPQGQILKNRIRMHHDKQPGQGGSPPFDGRPFRTGATDRKAAPHDHRFSHDPERAHPQSNLASALGRIDGRLHLGGRLGRRVIGRRGRSTKIHVQHRRM